tara:strand:+ start:363 stop:506 length:144 start_codon:yes stop_codon:yes gene_type:complete
MLKIEELMILREALEMYAQGILNREFSIQLQEIERKLQVMMSHQEAS